MMTIGNQVKLIMFVILLGVAPISKACFWISGTTIDGGYSDTLSPPRSHVLGLFQSYQTDASQEILKRLKNSKVDIPDQSLLEFIANGQYAKAIAGYHRFDEKNKNSSYYIASNLGTAYELSGNFEKARYWIAQGIERNNDAHYGSEWLHLYILDYKRGVIHKHFSELMQEDSDSQYYVVFEKQKYSEGQIYTALLYQLRERLLFVKKNSPMVGDLLYSLALVEAKHSSLEAGVELLELAESFVDADQAGYMTKLREDYQVRISSVSWWRYVMGSRVLGFWWVGAIVITAWFLLRFCSKRIDQKKRQSTG